jgi:hypothetical protein
VVWARRDAVLISQIQVKKVLVPQRENPIVNRLNKTKIEKFPDLALEKEEKLKALRKKDQAARLERVSWFQDYIYNTINFFSRKRKRPELLRSGRKRSGRRIMPMMNFFRSRIQRKQITRIVVRIGRMTLCNSIPFNTIWI